MSRFLLATLGSLGDLHPLIAIGLKLREHGHAVAFCTSGSYQARIESLGFAFRALRPDLRLDDPAWRELAREAMDAKKGADRLLRGFLFPYLRETYEDLLRAVVAGGADVLVNGEIVYAAPPVVDKTGVRWATCITMPMSFFSAYEPPVLGPAPWLARCRPLGPGINRLILQVVKSFARTLSQPVREFRAELGLPPGRNPIFEGKFSPALVLAMFSRVLAEPQPDWPPNTVVTGFPFFDGAAEEQPLAPELAQYLEAGPPPIVFTLGSAAVIDPGNFYHVSAQAAALLKRRAVLLVGPNPPPAPLPEGVVAFDYVPFSGLFPRAAAIVHQGGVGTTGQALRAGRPMLVMPYGHDQPDNARRVTRLGVARTISRRRYSPVRVAEALAELLADADCARTAARLSRVVRSEDGATVACDALERLVA